MARRKALQNYPKEYFEIFRHADRKAINIRHETKAQAEATRNDLYTFRQVLYDEGEAVHEILKTAAQNVRLAVHEATRTCEPIRERKEKEDGSLCKPEKW